MFICSRAKWDFAPPGLRPNSALSYLLQMQFEKWCDTVNEKRGVAVEGQKKSQPPMADAEIQITSGR